MSGLGVWGQRWLSSAAGTLDQVACLKEVRSVLRLSGPTLVHFLQGLVTNDVTHITHPQTTPIYTCILNAQGRYLHDILLHPMPSTTDALPAVLLDTDASGSADLLRLLKRYRLRQKIEIDDVSEELEVWAGFKDPHLIATSSSINNNTNTSEILKGSEMDSWPQDPRLPALGFRAILPSGCTVPLSTATTESIIVPSEAYRRWRISQGIAEGDSEIATGEAIALEYNIDGLNGISFTKGCYVGQELMARTHFKGVVRKRVMPFEILHDGNNTSAAASASTAHDARGSNVDTRLIGVKGGENVIDGSSGKVLGSVRVVDGGQGLAHLRLKEAQEGMRGERVLRTESGFEIRPWRPEWWPQTWGREG